MADHLAVLLPGLNDVISVWRCGQQRDRGDRKKADISDQNCAAA
jgi:hypothetical protein